MVTYFTLPCLPVSFTNFHSHLGYTRDIEAFRLGLGGRLLHNTEQIPPILVDLWGSLPSWTLDSRIQRVSNRDLFWLEPFHCDLEASRIVGCPHMDFLLVRKCTRCNPDANFLLRVSRGFHRSNPISPIMIWSGAVSSSFLFWSASYDFLLAPTLSNQV